MKGKRKNVFIVVISAISGVVLFCIFKIASLFGRKKEKVNEQN